MVGRGDKGLCSASQMNNVMCSKTTMCACVHTHTHSHRHTNTHYNAPVTVRTEEGLAAVSFLNKRQNKLMLSNISSLDFSFFK